MLPSGEIATSGELPCDKSVKKRLTPSEASSSVLRIFEVFPAIHASSSPLAMCISPHPPYNHKERSSARANQKSRLQGSPSFAVIVSKCPSFSRLRPPSVATHSAPSPSNRTSLTRPGPSPSDAVKDL